MRTCFPRNFKNCLWQMFFTAECERVNLQTVRTHDKTSVVDVIWDEPCPSSVTTNRITEKASVNAALRLDWARKKSSNQAESRSFYHTSLFGNQVQATYRRVTPYLCHVGFAYKRYISNIFLPEQPHTPRNINKSAVPLASSSFTTANICTKFSSWNRKKEKRFAG